MRIGFSSFRRACRMTCKVTRVLQAGQDRRAGGNPRVPYAWNLKMPHNRVKSDRFYSKQFCNRMLTEILPTLRKISREISKCRTAEDLKEFILGKNARTVLVDGTHIPVRRSGDAERRNSTCSGKKKTHTYNTTVTSAKNNIISGIGRIVVGKTHDITLFREDPLPFGRWYERDVR